MTKYNKRLLIVILGAVLWSLGIVWILFNREVRDTLLQRENTFCLVAICYFAVLVCAFYFIAKRLPHIAMGLACLSACLFLFSVYAVASVVSQ